MNEKSVVLKKASMILLTVVFVIYGFIASKIAIETNLIGGKGLNAKTYEQLTDADYETQSENVKFSAFFAKNLNNDENAQRVKGVTRVLGTDGSLGDDGTLYIDLNVSKEGYLENGKITLQTNNINWETAMVEDSIVSGNYIGKTNAIQLKDKIFAGSAKRFEGEISPKLSNNISSYGQVNSITLTGTYVDGNENRTDINITKNVTVDWIGSVNTKIDSANQNLNVSTSSNEMRVYFTVENHELNKQLMLKDNVLKITAPVINGYKATGIEVNSADNVEFDKNSGEATITRSSTVNENGNITKYLSSVNKYNIALIYPREAHGDNIADNKLFTKLEIPVHATYVGYNNQNEGFEHLLSSSDDALLVLVEEKGEIAYNKDALNVTVGEKVDSRYIVSKEKALQAYSGEVSDDDYFDVTWTLVRQDRKTNGDISLTETKKDQFVMKNATYGYLTDYAENEGIWFDSYGSLKSLKIYNDDTDELIKSFTADEVRLYNKTNPYKYDESVKSIRIDIEKSSLDSKFNIHQIKRLNNESIINNMSKEDFDNIVGIFTYLTADGDQYAHPSEFAGYANYQEKTSNVTMYISNSNINTEETEVDEKIFITTSAREFNQVKWKNGVFLVEFPENVIFTEIENINIDNPDVQVSAYDLYKENGKYFAKVYTSNDTEAEYTIVIDTKMYINPIVPSSTEQFVLYAYNEDCYTYLNSTEDIYDINNNQNTHDYVGNYKSNISFIAPNIMLTSQTASNYNENGEVAIAPNIADINPEDRTVDININLLNNYSRTVSDVKVIGEVPFEGNTYIEGTEVLGSQFTAKMKNTGVKLPEDLEGKVTVYYSENPTADKDLENVENGWVKNPEDFSKIKRFLIDFNNYTIPSGNYYTFTYTVEVPEGISYNQITFSESAVYYSLDTTEGKLEYPPIEPSKLGIRVTRKYNLDVTKLNSENNKPIKNAVYKLTEFDDVENELSHKLITSNEEGKLISKGLFINRIYTLEEIKNPENYMLNAQKIKFKVIENNDYSLGITVLSEDNFKTTPIINDNLTLVALIIEEPKYKINVTKKDKVTGEKIPGVVFALLPDNKTYVTNSNGQFTMTALDQNKEYTLKENYADGYYLIDDITFKLVKENEQFKIVSENVNFANAEVRVIENEDLLNVDIEIENEKQPEILINKKDKETGETLKDVQFTVTDKYGKVYTTDQEGKVLINGFEENKDYTVKEIKAKGYYLQEVTFKIVKDETGKLKIQSENEEFNNAVLIDENSKTLSINLTNKKIPVYNLKITKTSKGNLNKKLEGAKFSLLSEDDESIKEYTTDENGEINIEDLYVYRQEENLTGNYTLQEIESPNGYCNNTEQIKFKVKEVSEDNYQVEIADQNDLVTLNRASLEGNTLNLIIEDKPLFTLTKLDSETKQPLKGVKFVIMELGTPITFAKDINGNYVGTLNENNQYIVTTDENGQIALALRNGNYVAIEQTYLDGYENRNAVEYFEVKDGVSTYTSGSDSSPEDDNFEITEITSIEDLIQFSNSVSSGNTYEGKKVILKNDIEFTDETLFTPIGIGQDYSLGITQSYPFKGEFDGNGHEIKNINIEGNRYVGLFGYVSNSKIKNITVSGKVNAQGYAGGLIGHADESIIENCINKVSVETTDYCVGGICGEGMHISIKNCINEGIINSTGGDIGGIVGAIYADNSTIENCSNIGEVSGNGYNGGIIGYASENSLKIINCNNKGTINGNNYNYTGGIVGGSSVKIIIDKCYNEGIINGKQYVAGICGYASGDIQLLNSYNKGEVNADNYVGGLVGCAYDDLVVDKCYNEGKINFAGYYLGGLVAYWSGESNEQLSLNNSYNKGNINFTGSYGSITAGGIIGEFSYTRLGEISNCYNDSDIIVDNSIQVRYLRLGGIVGKGNVQSTIRSCYNTGNLGGKGNTVYIGGIAGEESTVVDCYNTGNINAEGFSYSYLGGIIGNYGSVTNSYNTGIINNVSASCYVGGIAGQCGDNITNCYNAGEINVTIKESSNSVYLGGIVGYGSSVKDSYNVGNIKCRMIGDNYNFVNGIAGQGSANNCVNTGTLEYSRPENATKYSVVGGFDTPDAYIPDIKSEEYYTILNTNDLWTHIDGYAPKLLVNSANPIDGVQIDVFNILSKYNITTEVEAENGVKGGTITGEGENPYEAVSYGQANTKEIVMQPEEGYAIKEIKINDVPISFRRDDEGKFTIGENYFTNMNEDKHIVVSFDLQEEVTIVNERDVTVHHYLKNNSGEYTTIKVADDETKTYKEGENYQTSPKINLKDFELEKNENGEYITPNNVSGIIGENDIVVNYYYIAKPIQLTIHHYLDGTNQKLAEDENNTYEPTIQTENERVVDCSTDETYNVVRNENYLRLLSRNYSSTLITQDSEKVDDEEVELSGNSELTYYYTVSEGKVTVQYLNKLTGQSIIPSESFIEKIGKTYTIPIKDIAGYTYVERDGDLSGKYEIQDKVVKLYYKKNTTVRVNHIDKSLDETLPLEQRLLDTKTYNGFVGDEFTSASKNFDGYVLVQRPENETVTLTEDEIVLNYYYNKVMSGVIEKHIDIKDNSILYNEEHTGGIGEEYNISSKTFEDYDLVEDQLPTNFHGNYGEELIEVRYYYIKKSKVEVHYINKITGRDFIDPITLNGHEDDDYQTELKSFEGFDLIEMPENHKGKMKKEKIIVNYNYTKKRAKVEVKYLEKGTNKQLAETVIKNGYDGDAYTTEPKDVPFYKLIEIPINKEGIMRVIINGGNVQDTTEVIYYYQALKFNLKVDKVISKIIIDGEEKAVANGKLAKTEIHKKNLSKTTLKVEYLIKVSNTGEIAGGTKLRETIPEGFIMNEAENPNWSINAGVAEINIDNINPGEEKEIKVVLQWKQGENNIGNKINLASILEFNNQAKFEDADKSDNESSATLILTIETGIYVDTEEIVYAVVIALIAILGIGVYIKISKNNI